jgi:HlyD family secretion protein
MSRRLWIAAAAVVAAAALLVWQQQPSAVPPPVAVHEAATGVGALGRVEPASRVRKLAQPGGFSVNRVERLLVEEGDPVAANQVLAELSDAAQKDAAVAQAEAALAEARATVTKVRTAGRPSEIAAQFARIASLSAMEDIDRRDAERAEALVPSGAGARAQAERNRAAAAKAAADKAEAQAQLETLSQPRPEDVAVAEAQLRSAESSLARARADAELSRVRAPIAGTILKIYARAGDLIGNDGLLDLADLSRMDVVADVYETDLPRLRAGAPAQVIVPGDSHRYAATLREIGWQVRRTTQAGSDPVAAVDARTVEVRLTLADDGRDALRQRTNMQVQVAIRP